MRFPKTFTLLLLAASTCTLAASAQPARAQSFAYIQKTYKVQVEYWFLDTDYYFWSTFYETTDLEDAQLVYDLLVIADQNGLLNQAAPNSYSRYFAVDVRMITEYQYPLWSKPFSYDLEPIDRRL
jgi:hypothetical protein